jgi:fructose-1,6-bisphosphatase/inositol monophosphatase family enzyme
VVGEEASHADASVQDRLSGDCWIVDPLDGTRNFAKGQPPFGILIAMASGGEAHTGWIYDCLTDRILHRPSRQGRVRQRREDRSAADRGNAAGRGVSLIFMDRARREAPRPRSADYARSTCPTAPPNSIRASRSG